MDFDLMISSFPKLLNATLITLKLLSASLIIGLILGLLFSIMRINKNPIINKPLKNSISLFYLSHGLCVKVFCFRIFTLGKSEASLSRKHISGNMIFMVLVKVKF